LFTGVVDTGEKFITGVIVTGDHCSPVSLILAKNSNFIASAVVTVDNSPVSLKLAKNLSSVSLSPAQRCQ
jgi:hypothetical protein